MKKLLIAFLLLLSFKSNSQLIIAPSGNAAPAGNYPAIFDIHLKGGYRAVKDTFERNSIPLSFRKNMMLVGDTTSRKVWLFDSLRNSWSEFGGGSSQSLQSVTTVGNSTNTGIQIKNSGGDVVSELFNNGEIKTGILGNAGILSTGDITVIGDWNGNSGGVPIYQAIDADNKNIEQHGQVQVWGQVDEHDYETLNYQIGANGFQVFDADGNNTAQIGRDGSLLANGVNLVHGNVAFSGSGDDVVAYLKSDTYLDGLFRIESLNSFVGLGDIEGDVNYTYIKLKDNLETITANANNGFIVTAPLDFRNTDRAGLWTPSTTQTFIGARGDEATYSGDGNQIEVNDGSDAIKFWSRDYNMGTPTAVFNASGSGSLARENIIWGSDGQWNLPNASIAADGTLNLPNAGISPNGNFETSGQVLADNFAIQSEGFYVNSSGNAYATDADNNVYGEVANKNWVTSYNWSNSTASVGYADNADISNSASNANNADNATSANSLYNTWTAYAYDLTTSWQAGIITPNWSINLDGDASLASASIGGEGDKTYINTSGASGYSSDYGNTVWQIDNANGSAYFANNYAIINSNGSVSFDNGAITSDGSGNININSLNLFDVTNGDYSNLSINDHTLNINKSNIGPVLQLDFNSISSNKLQVFQDKNGTLALTSDIQSAKGSHTIFTPTTGSTITSINNQVNVVNPSGALLALTITLPSSPSNNDVVEFKFTKAITTVSYSGGTVAAPLTSPIAGSFLKWVYDSGTSTWY